MKKVIVACLLWLYASLAVAQESKHFDTAFFNYLVNKKLYSEVISYLNPYKTDSTIEVKMAFIHAAYCMKQNDSFSSPSHTAFMEAYLTTFDTNLGKGMNVLVQAELVVSELQDAEKTGVLKSKISYINTQNQAQWQFLNPLIALLNKDQTAFNNYLALCDSTRNNFFYEQLIADSKELFTYTKKKPWLAGVFSAMLPGAGKVYVGKPLQGIASITGIALLALQAGEGYSHKGFKSPHFYLFGGLAAVFYFGNIYGSVYSAAVSQHKKDAYYHHRFTSLLQQLLAQG
jgi:hypothetical protein